MTQAEQQAIERAEKLLANNLNASEQKLFVMMKDKIKSLPRPKQVALMRRIIGMCIRRVNERATRGDK